MFRWDTFERFIENNPKWISIHLYVDCTYMRVAAAVRLPECARERVLDLVVLGAGIDLGQGQG